MTVRRSVLLTGIAMGLIALVVALKSFHGGTTTFRISPYPDGKDFGFSIIDDTDYSDGPEIEPVYDLLNGLGIKTTKTVWMFDQIRSGTYRREYERTSGFEESGASMENPGYSSLIRKIHDQGFEIALHGVSAGNDYRAEILEGYETFKIIFGDYPRMDILHATNIENLYSGYYKLDNPVLKMVEKLVHNSDYQGHIPGSDYFWGDICRDRIKYVRLPFHAIKEINLLKLNPSMPFHDQRRSYVNYWFPNSDGSDHRDFMELTSRENMERLIVERGTTIIYTHFANQFSKKEGDAYVLKKDFVDRMRYIGSLNGWFVPASILLDRLLMVRSIRLINENDVLLIINQGDQDIYGLTILCERGTNLYTSHNGHLRADDRGEVIVEALPSKSTMTLFKRKVTRVSASINRWERMKIELYNYVGELM